MITAYNASNLRELELALLHQQPENPMSLEQALETLAASITRLAAAVDGAKAVPQAAADAVKVLPKPEPKAEQSVTTQSTEPVAQSAVTAGEFPLEQLSARVQEALRAKKGPQAAEILRDIGNGAVKASAVPANLRKQVFDAIGLVLTSGK